jgi:membrane-associated phospholipid phosphatase
MILITWFRSFPTYRMLFAGADLRLRRWGRRQQAVLLLICLVGAHVLNLGLKLFYRRPRPDFFPLIRTGDYSFPGGHAMVSLPLHGFQAYAGSRHSPRLRSSLVGLSFLLTLAIGVSRIYLWVHWTSDGLTGYAAGAIGPVSCIFAAGVSLNLRRRKHFYS